jgi:hypothetical protein
MLQKKSSGDISPIMNLLWLRNQRNRHSKVLRLPRNRLTHFRRSKPAQRAVNPIPQTMFKAYQRKDSPSPL